MQTKIGRACSGESIDLPMKKNLHSKSGGFSPRLLLAFGLFLISGVLALSAFTESHLTSIARPGRTSAATTSSVPLNATLGHSYWNELLTSINLVCRLLLEKKKIHIKF